MLNNVGDKLFIDQLLEFDLLDVEIFIWSVVDECRIWREDDLMVGGSGQGNIRWLKKINGNVCCRHVMRSYYNIVGMWLLVVDEKTKLRVL